MTLTSWSPSVDILRGREHWFVKMELAGVCLDKVNIAAVGNTLTISGARRDSMISRELTYQTLEISYCGFERRVQFPFAIDQSAINCQYQDGMLLIQVRSLSILPLCE